MGRVEEPEDLKEEKKSTTDISMATPDKESAMNSRPASPIIASRRFMLCSLLPPLLSIANLALPLLALPVTAASNTHELMKEVRYILPEEQPIGKILGTIELWGSGGTTFNPHQRADGQTQFLFLRQQDLFSLDERTGILKTNARIDREDICANKKNCEILLDVAVKSQHSTRIVRVTVTIIDLNDNTPEFAGEGRVLEIPESATVGSSYPIPLAFDKDSPEFGVRHYKMISDDDYDLSWFRLDTANSFGDYTSDWLFGRQPHMLLYRGDKDGEQPRLTLIRSLDRETKDIHKLTIVAVDGGTPARSGTVDLTIIVKDVNDNVPTFEQSHYSTVVQENVPILTNVLQVRATDPDFDLNGQIVYSLYPSPQLSDGASAQQIFGIDSKSGEVYVKGVVDHEAASSYKFVVVARDSGAEPTSSSAMLTIHVTDMNDNPPEITVDTLSQTPGVAEAVEEMEPGAFVAHATVTDRDSGENGKTTCRLNSTEKFRLVSTTTRDDGGDYQVVTRSRLDRETANRHDLALICHDSGNEQLTSSVSIIVNVLDINDNAPIFEQQVYSTQLTENNHVGEEIIRVSAIDPDEGPNGRIIYFIDDNHYLSSTSIASNFDQLFYVEPDTGVVKAAVSFDRERGSTVEFKVGAKDRGTPSLTGTALVRVTILDVNDESPRFSQSAYSFAVRENQPSGTEVGSVAAIDLDADRFGEVTYSLYLSSAQQLSVLHLTSMSSPSLLSAPVQLGLFDINPRSGSIYTLQSLDREVQSSYHVLVKASDGGMPPRTSQCTVIIYVADENDNDPQFEFPTPSNSTVVVSNLVPKRFIVARLRAKDADFSGNARVTFSLLKETSYYLLVKVPDYLDDIDDDEDDAREDSFSPPSALTRSQPSVDFQRSAVADLFESDTGSNIVDNKCPKYFQVDPSLGILYLLDDLENEDGKTFVLWLAVRDEGMPERSSTTCLVVMVNSSVPFSTPGHDEFFQESLSGGYFAGAGGQSASHHFWIVLLLAVISGVVVIILIVAIVVVCRQDDKRSSDSYNCRMESLKMMPCPDNRKNNNLFDGELSDPDEKLNNKVTYNAKVKSSTATSSCGEDGLKESEEKLFKPTDEHNDVIKVSNPYVEHRQTPVYSTFQPANQQQANDAVPKSAKVVKGPEDESLNSSGDGSNADSGRGCSEDGVTNAMMLRHHQQQQQQQQHQHQQHNSLHAANKNLNHSANQRAPYQSHDQSTNPSASSSQTTTILISSSLCDYDNYTSMGRQRLLSGTQYPAVKPGQAKTLNGDQIRSSNVKLQQFQQLPMSTLSRCPAKNQRMESPYLATGDAREAYYHQPLNSGLRQGAKNVNPVYAYPHQGQMDSMKRQSQTQVIVPQNKNFIMRWPDNTEYKAAIGLSNASFGHTGNDVTMTQNRLT